MWHLPTERKWRLTPNVSYICLGQVHYIPADIRIAEQLERYGSMSNPLPNRNQVDSAPVTYHQITPEKVEKALEQIDDARTGVDAEQESESEGRVRKSWLNNSGNMNHRKDTLTDATVTQRQTMMPLSCAKEDHMKNGS